jgi:L-ascorbate metabolism protein UlaG (beta-lactamase superfamily)
LAIVTLAAAAYAKAPRFWRQYFRELGRPVSPPRRRPAPDAWRDSGLYAAWLGHSTVLLKIDGFTVLTDPVFSDRIGPGLGPLVLGVKRLIQPAVPLNRLPKLDLVLLSHAHFDHCDLPSLRDLESPRTSVVTALSTSDLLRTDGYGSVHEIGWGQSVEVGPIRLRAFEVRHWGARLRSDRHRGYNGYVIEAGRYRLAFAGDTAFTHKLAALRSAVPFSLAILPIGAYNPWISNHCTPEEAWTMANQLGAERLIPIHHQTFSLSNEPQFEPIGRLMERAGREAERVAVSQVGHELRLG